MRFSPNMYKKCRQRAKNGRKFNFIGLGVSSLLINQFLIIKERIVSITLILGRGRVS